MTQDTRLIAFYLPQYHPIPENDQWWGEGFTEWTNVNKAKPLFKGHYQPHVPADLGQYDLRSPKAREHQAQLAQEYGIYGFCYYHFWFNGKRLLEQPFNEVLTSGTPDFPFCLCWSNENWTRVWDGGKDHILMEQKYSDEDDRNHIRWLVNAFKDRRYIRVEGKPLYLVYRVSELPNPLRTTSIWREEARKLGIGEIFLCKVESFRQTGDPVEMGFDAAVEFPPHFQQIKRNQLSQITGLMKYYWSKLGLKGSSQRRSEVLTYDYSKIIRKLIKTKLPTYRRFPCVMPSWDNTPRRQKSGSVFVNSKPETYEFWLRETLKKVHKSQDKEKIVFINAWNEWGEGNHLEPDLKFGRGYLEATKRALNSFNHDK